MTVGSPLLFPSSRVLAGWWPALAPWRPVALWFAHLLLHHVEALVSVAQTRSVDLLETALLRALRNLGNSASLLDLDRSLHVGPQFLATILQRLARQKLIHQEGNAWTLLEPGMEALGTGSYEDVSEERRAFHFVQPSDLSAQRRAPPHFLALEEAACHPASAAADWHFDPQWLTACTAKPPEWKTQHGFPATVRRVVGWDTGKSVSDTSASEEPAVAWRKILYDRPEQLGALLIIASSAEGTARILGFHVQEDGWKLTAEKPAFTLQNGPEAIFPGLSLEPDASAWQEAWLEWCANQRISKEECAAANLDLDGVSLRIQASPELSAKLRQTDELHQSEPWLIAGHGPCRRVARVELQAKA